MTIFLFLGPLTGALEWILVCFFRYAVLLLDLFKFWKGLGGVVETRLFVHHALQLTYTVSVDYHLAAL